MFQCGVKENGLPRRCAPRDGGIPRFIDLPPSPFRENDMVILGPARRFLRLMQGAGLFSQSVKEHVQQGADKRAAGELEG